MPDKHTELADGNLARLVGTAGEGIISILLVVRLTHPGCRLASVMANRLPGVVDCECEMSPALVQTGFGNCILFLVS